MNNQKIDNQIQKSSFRDPSGFCFFYQGEIYRQINQSYAKNYDLLVESGLLKSLTENQLLISAKEVDLPKLPSVGAAYKTIKPKRIPFISYPYEWSFSELRDAAMLTLKVQKLALKNGMGLKDASAFNVQFLDGRPILIDSLSFEKYQEGQPWVAYRQFCQHFLAPLALMSQVDIRLNQLGRIFIDGVPLDLASTLLPLKTKFNFSLLAHLHWHAASQKKYQDKAVRLSRQQISPLALLGIVDSLESAVKKLSWQAAGSEWADYYQKTNYSQQSIEEKKRLVKKFLDQLQPKIVWDLGANDGTFSRMASDQHILTVAFDVDAAAVEKNYQTVKQKGEKNILPLVLDLVNPSPAIGWANSERDSLASRGQADCALALALIHHLAISNNLPFIKIAQYFSQIAKSLIIEFVPKDDSQVQKLLVTREDIFVDYCQQTFEDCFQRYFSIAAREKIGDSKRVLYLMTNK